MNGQYVRTEIWTDFECADGLRVAVLPGVSSIVETMSLSGDNQLQVTCVANSAGTEEIFHRRVVRVVSDIGDYDEWRLSAIETGRDNGTICDMTAVDVMREWTEKALVVRHESDGSSVFQFEVVGLTLSEIVAAYILPSLADVGQGWWSLGAIERDTLIPSCVFEWTTVMEALRRLVQDAGVELTRTRIGTTGYSIDFPMKVGSAARTAQARYGKNMLSGKRRVSGDNQATVIYGRGSDTSEGFSTDMSAATWRVIAVDGPTRMVTLDDGLGGDGPVGMDDQLNGMFANGILVQDSFYVDSSIQVANVATFSVGTIVRFTDANNRPVVALSDPSQVVVYGRKISVLTRPDLPNTVNLLPNAALRFWTDGFPPVGWGVDGSVTAVRTTDPLFTRFGGQSMLMQVNYPGAGVSLVGPITPTAAHPFFSGLALLQVVSGRARIELWFSTTTATIIRPSGGDAIATTTTKGVWEEIGFAGVDAYKLGAIFGAVVIMQDGPEPLVCYLDGVQLTNTPTQMSYFEGNGATALWQAVNQRLTLYATPMVSLAASVIDPQEFAYGTVVLGGRVAQTDDALYQPVSTRIVGYSRELTNRLVLNLTLSSDPADVIDTLARPRRPETIKRRSDVTAIPTVSAYFSDVPGSPGVISVRLEAIPADAVVYWQALDIADPVPPIGDGSWIQYSNTVTVNASGDPLKLVAYARIGGTTSSVVAYPLDSNSVANITASATESPAGTFVLNWVPDDDTARVDIYRVTNGAGSGYPTVGGSLTGALLGTAWRGWKSPNYNGGGLKYDGTNWMGGTSYSEAVANGTVVGYAIVATSRNGLTADPVFGKITIAGVLAPALASFSLDSLSLGTNIVMNVSWSNNAAITSSHAIDLYISIDGSDWGLQSTIDPATSATTESLSTGMSSSSGKFDPTTSFRARAVLRSGVTELASYVSEALYTQTTGER